jgi:hypothetical protein
MKEIVSHSGTTHYENPKPSHLGSGGLPMGRVQTLCEMHIRKDEITPPSGDMCRFCKAEAEKQGLE